ncbi:MAG TPA: serine/threonine-protein kinase [Kofleriaceae bacterium]
MTAAHESSGPVSDALIGQRFGDTVIIEKLGEGGMGAVYKARDEGIGRLVVIKVLSQRALGSLNVQSANLIRQRFLAEGRSLGKFSHPNIVAVYASGPEPVPFIKMELLQGLPLDAYVNGLAGQRLHHYPALRIILQLCRGVVVLHNAGLVHRDLKLENLFITPDGTLKLIDFGIIKELERADGEGLTQGPTAMGTPGFMAPELWWQAHKASPATDLYAIAVIAWRLVTGFLPFPMPDDGDLMTLAFRQVNDPPRLVGNDLPPAWGLALSRALAPEAQHRGTIQQLAGALVAAVEPPSPHLPTGPQMLTMYGGHELAEIKLTDETYRIGANAQLFGDVPLPRPSLPTPINAAPVGTPLHTRASANPAARPAHEPAITPHAPVALASAFAPVAAAHARVAAAQTTVAPASPTPPGRRWIIVIAILGALCAAVAFISRHGSASQQVAPTPDAGAPSVSTSRDAASPDAGAVNSLQVDAAASAAVDAAPAIQPASPAAATKPHPSSAETHVRPHPPIAHEAPPTTTAPTTTTTQPPPTARPTAPRTTPTDDDDFDPEAPARGKRTK